MGWGGGGDQKTAGQKSAEKKGKKSLKGFHSELRVDMVREQFRTESPSPTVTSFEKRGGLGDESNSGSRQKKNFGVVNKDGQEVFAIWKSASRGNYQKGKQRGMRTVQSTYLGAQGGGWGEVAGGPRRGGVGSLGGGIRSPGTQEKHEKKKGIKIFHLLTQTPRTEKSQNKEMW